MSGHELDDAVAQIREAAAAKKCWSCGCLHESLAAIERAYEGATPGALAQAMTAARERLVPARYDCLGCEVCYPALAVNALNGIEGGPLVDLGLCPTEKVEERSGWPPLPGSYVVSRYAAPVAVCALTSEKLAKALSETAGPDVSIVGTLDTENLGIERLITNVVANPNIRALVVCGADSKQAVGHLPGQSLVALAGSGIDEKGRIVGSRGKRPVLKNVSREAIEHFRRTVSVIDLVGVEDPTKITAAIRAAAATNPGPATPFAPERVVKPVRGTIPDRMIPDPAGYFVVYVDRARRLISTEHYTNDGVLDSVVEGATAAEVYCTVIDGGFVSRLDHAAYLGGELARAERALGAGEPYVQDGAAEKRALKPSLLTLAPAASGSSCGCAPSASCGGSS